MSRDSGGATPPVGHGPTESRLGDDLIDAGLRCGRWQHRLVHLAGEFDESGEWALDGAVTCAHWIAKRLDVEVCTAREWIRIGRALAKMPALDAAFAERRISFSKVRILTRVATSDTAAELVDLAQRTPAGLLSRAVAAWLIRNERPEDTERRQHRDRSLRMRTEPDGMIVGTFRLPPLAGAELRASVDKLVMGRLTTADAESGRDATADASVSTESGNRTEHPSLAQQRADALMELVTGGGAAVITEVVIHVRGDGATLDDGTPIADSVVERLAPQSFIRLLIHDAERRPINASGRQRHPTARQMAVVKERDQRCVDCDAEVFLEFDHEKDFKQSRRTEIDDGKLRCYRCHAKRHRDDDERKLAE